MSDLRDLIAQHCPSGVPYISVDEALSAVSTPRGVKRGAYLDAGRIAIVDQGQSIIAGFTDDESLLVPPGTYIVFGDHTRAVKWVDFPFAVGADGTKVLRPKDGLLAKYAYFAMSSLEIPDRGYNRHWSVVKGLRIAIPPLEVQLKIVQILDDMTQMETDLRMQLEDELAFRRRQFSAYRDELIGPNDAEGVRVRPLGAVCSVSDGTHQTPRYTSGGVRFVSVENIASPGDSKKYISEEEFERLYKVKPRRDDLFMTRIGSIGVCSVVKTDEPLAYYVTLALLRPDSREVDSRYLKHAIESNVGRSELRMRTLVNAVPKKINLGEISKVRLPMPALEKQIQIAETLDNLGALISDLSNALPAEVVARRRQYQYYRDKLLTFDEAPA